MKNKKVSKETKEKISKTLKQLFNEDKIKVWNKGLTKETDERVRKIAYTKTGIKYSKEKYHNHGMRNKKHSEITKQKLRKPNYKNRGENNGMSKKENRDKISKTVRKKYENGYINPLKGKEITLLSRIRMSAKKQGIPLNEWKIFISKEPYGYEFNERLKEQIRERDDYRCQRCGSKTEENLSVHHIDFNKKNNNPDNLISLCRKHHRKTFTYRTYWIRVYQRMMNEFVVYKNPL